MNESLETQVAVFIQHPAGSDAYEQAEEIIALVQQHERRRIREALLSDVTAMLLERDIQGFAEADLADDYRAMAESLAEFAAGYIGLTEENPS